MVHPEFNPVAISLGPLNVYWYGLMYLAAFLVGQYLGIWRASRDAWRNFTPDDVRDLVFYSVLGIIIGGRAGYVFFYQFGAFLDDPIYLFKIMDGGMSFHGGFLGVCAAVALFARNKNKPLWTVADFIAPLVPQGLFFGRWGNFMNQELWGRETEVAWGMIFPAVDELTRHPSQLYQMLGEGLLLFVLLWWFSSKPRPRKAVAAFFMIGYGVLRTSAEFFREPDRHIGYLLGGNMTQGMLLSIPMILVGCVLIYLAYRSPVFDEAPQPVSKKSTAKAKTKKTQAKKS